MELGGIYLQLYTLWEGGGRWRKVNIIDTEAIKHQNVHHMMNTMDWGSAYLQHPHSKRLNSSYLTILVTQIISIFV